MTVSSPIEVLEAALDAARARRDMYGPASERVAFETARAADYVMMGDLLGFAPKGHTARMELAIRQWGINDAFARTIPSEPVAQQFRFFPSHPENQAQVDDHLFLCGSIRLGERMLGWLREGLVTGEYREHRHPERGRIRVLILNTADASLGDEAVNRTWLRWEADGKVRAGRAREAELAKALQKMEPQLARMCQLIGGAHPAYDEAFALLDAFVEFGSHYVDRMFGRDLLDPADVIGGLPFQDYLDTVRILSGLQHLHLAVLQLLRARHPGLEIRNLMAWPSAVETTRNLIARRLDCEGGAVDALLAPLTLSGSNASRHAASGDPVWPALIRASRDTFIHPLFGLDVNPHLFLLSNLRFEHRSDWDRATDGREERWQAELETLLTGSPYDQIRRDGLMLRDNGKDLTDIDFAAYNRVNGDLLLFQLKWQHPFDADDRARRSMGRNLVTKGNEWIEKVCDWTSNHGTGELVRRLGFTLGEEPRPRLVVLARYGAQFSGWSARDRRATWTSWPHFIKAWRHNVGKPARSLTDFIRRDAAEAKARYKAVSSPILIDDLGVLLNPTRVPPKPS